MQGRTFSRSPLLAGLTLALFATTAVAQNLRSHHQYETIAITPQALMAAAPTLPQKPAFDVIDAKLDTPLRAALHAQANGVAWSRAWPAALRRDKAVLVEIQTTAVADITATRALLARHGASLHNAMGATLREAWMPLDRVRELAGDPAVLRVSTARLVRHLATPTLSQGIAAGNADYWQGFSPAYTGTGITIALIDSYDNSKIASLQSSGDWPPNARLKCFDLKNTSANPPYATSSCTSSNFGSAGVRHGDATMELAYDIAPAASYRAYDTNTVGDWYNAILDAAHVNSSGQSQGSVNANVISASLAAPQDGKGDGSALPGSIAQAAGYAKARGILVVNAAGNERQTHWGGLYTSASSNSAFHTWHTSNTIYNPFGDGNGSVDCIPDGQPISVDMYWNNWVTPGSNHDYDVSLYQNTGSANTPTWSLVASSNNLQSGGTAQTPQEHIAYTATAGATTGCPAQTAVYAIAVVRVAGTTARDNLQVFVSAGGSHLYYSVGSRSLVFPADSANVLSVAAIDVANATSDPQEPFSSQGPVLTTGGGLPGNPNPASDAHLKPDLASFDHVSTVSIGASAFYGTSAATPHVAGMAALFMQRVGIPANAASLTNSIITPLLAIAATGSNDLGSPAGRDYSYGFGRLRFQRDAALGFIQQPSNTLVNNSISPAIKVGLYDDEGKLDLYTLFDTLNLDFGNDPSGGVATISGGSATPTSGVATFTAAKINHGGTGYSIEASVNIASTPPIMLSVTSNAFNITTGAPKKLLFTQQPTAVFAGAAIAPAVSVRVVDINDNLVVSDNTTSISLQRTTCTGAAPMGGGPLTVSNGVVTFPQLTLYALASNAQIRAVAQGLTTTTSNAFNVRANADIVFRNGLESCSP